VNSPGCFGTWTIRVNRKGPGIDTRTVQEINYRGYREDKFAIREYTYPLSKLGKSCFDKYKKTKPSVNGSLRLETVGGRIIKYLGCNVNRVKTGGFEFKAHDMSDKACGNGFLPEAPELDPAAPELDPVEDHSADITEADADFEDAPELDPVAPEMSPFDSAAVEKYCFDGHSNLPDGYQGPCSGIRFCNLCRCEGGQLQSTSKVCKRSKTGELANSLYFLLICCDGRFGLCSHDVRIQEN
jgi:hypothetical protein